MKTAIIVDSTATLCQELSSHPDIYQVPLSVIFSNGEAYYDTPDEEKTKLFYQQLSQIEEIPTTSQPEPKLFVDLYEQLVERGYSEVFLITLSSKISGTLSTGMMIAESFSDRIRTYGIDSKRTSFLIENMVQQALAMMEAGLESSEIAEKLRWVADHSVIYAGIEDLSFIKKSGRISGATAMVGNMLKIKPIIYFDEEGYVKIHSTVRTSRRIGDFFLERVEEALKQAEYKIELAFAHGNCEEEMAEIESRILKKFPDLKSRSGYLTGLLGVHGGPGTKGMGIIGQADF